MGWWKVTDVETGGISCKLPSCHPGGDIALHGGDQPADIMGNAISAIDKAYQEKWGRHAQPDELRACFNFVFNGWRRRVHAQVPPEGAAKAKAKPAEGSDSE